MPNHNHLALYRKRFALTQKEVGQLTGADDATVSRIEAGTRAPNIEFALGCEFLFGERPAEFFFGIAATVRDRVLQRLADFSIEIEGETGDAAEPRQDFLRAFAARENKEANPASA